MATKQTWEAKRQAAAVLRREGLTIYQIADALSIHWFTVWKYTKDVEGEKVRRTPKYVPADQRKLYHKLASGGMRSPELRAYFGGPQP